MECTNLVDSHQLLCPWFTVVFVLFCIYTPDNLYPRPIVNQGGGLFWILSDFLGTDCRGYTYGKQYEYDNNKKFSSTLPFCFLPCFFSSIRVDPGPYIVTIPENTYPRGKQGEIKVHRSNACGVHLSMNAQVVVNPSTDHDHDIYLLSRCNR